MTLAIQPLSDVPAAEVRGVDLREPLGDGDRAALNEAFLDRHILCFRDQELDKPAQLAATRQFGALDVHIQRNRGGDIPLVHTVSNLDADGNSKPEAAAKGNLRWHSDKSYRTAPSCETFLYAVKVPAQGGRTGFANMNRAFEAYSPERREASRGMEVVHDWARSCQKSGKREASPEEASVYPPTLVRRHPESGREAFFIGNHAWRILGMDRNEGEALLEEIEAHSTEDRFVYRHPWQPGDLLMWDNRCLLHRAESRTGEARAPHRTVTRGTSPF